MYHRRSQGDTKSSNEFNNSFSSIPTTNSVQSIPSSQSSPTSRISIYSMRDRVILDKMTGMMTKLAPNAETEVTNRFHQEIPAIRLDGHLTYCLYITIQNLIHLNAMHILLYHAVFWLNPVETENEVFQVVRKIEKTEYEQTLFLAISNDHYGIARPKINVHLINKYIYITLIGVSSIELIAAFIWTLQKKLACLIQRSPKWRNRLGLLLIGIIIILYLGFIAWLFFHTFITHHLTLTMFLIVISHLILLILLDKPNLFSDSSIDLLNKSFSTSNITRKQHRHSTSSPSMLSSTIINPINRLAFRSSTSVQPRKGNSMINSSFSSLKLSSRWLSTTEQKLDVHKCSTLYEQTRQEADELWRMVVRRTILKCYRTIASFILFDIVPLKMIDAGVRSIDNQRYKILIIIFALSTFLTHSIFLFPIKFQTNLHRLATHLGQWRFQPFLRTHTINEWSSECNSYTRGSVIKLPSNNEKHLIAIQHLSNAAHPQSISHSILYKLFGETTYFITIQFSICIILILCQILWIVCGKLWYEMLISSLIILNSSYTIYKIIRDRLIFDLVSNESDENLLTSKQKKSN